MIVDRLTASNASQPMIIAVFDSPGNPSDCLFAVLAVHKMDTIADFEKLKPVTCRYQCIVTKHSDNRIGN